MTTNKKFWVVGIGASAGGLEALTQFVAALPAESNACFVVAQHLAPHAKSMMVELVARQSPILVDVVTTEMKLTPNKVFIVPPNFDVDVQGDKLILTKAGDETRPKPSVDRFFTSLARSHTEYSVGIILSGTGSDGADGVRAIKEAGGVTMAQDEASAKFSGMPNSAVETGQVDFLMKPAELAKKVGEIVSGDAPFIADKVPDESHPGFQRVINLIKRELGSDFSQYKIGTIRRRLGKRMGSLGLDDIDDYVKVLETDDRELRALAQEFLVSVTSFFRDDEAFGAISALIEDLARAKGDSEELRLWSAGCATGEEAYSLAMIAAEATKKIDTKIFVKVFATDLDTDAISKARVGIYSDKEVASLPAGYIQKYFDKRGDEFEIKKSLRDLVVFARQDLIQSPPFVKLDLICCRNVIIYFENTLQRRVFEIFHYALKPSGVLFLGKSEAITGATELFEPLNKKAKIFRKLATAARTLPPSIRTPSAPLDQGIIRKKIAHAPSAVQMAQTQVLERFQIAGAIVTAEGVIETMIGDVSPYLKMSEGLDTFRLQNMLPKAAGVELQLLLKRALKNQDLQTSRNFSLRDTVGDKSTFRIQVSPLKQREISSSLTAAQLLVSFDKVHHDAREIAAHDETDADLALRAADLEQELEATKEHLQTVIEELGVTNEELQSTNEELSSTNEELQSSNEELETTNEEFQSTNEELSTVNDELQVKSAQLRSAFVDLENIQTSVGVPMMVVDEMLRLQRFNPSTKDLFDVNLADVGKNVSKISCRCEIDLFSEKIRSVIESGEVHESRVDAFKSVYQMRISPRFSDDQRIIGAVIIFFNNTELILAEQRLRKSEHETRGIIDGTSSLIFLKDISGKYLAVNQAFLKYFGFEESNVIGKSDREIFPDQFANQFRNGDLEAILKRGRVETTEDFAVKGTPSNFLVSRFPIGESEGANPYAVGTVAVDITAQVAAQAALKKSENLYRGVVEDQTVFVARFSRAGEINFVNTPFLKYFGGSKDDFVGQSLSKIIDVSDRANILSEFKKLSAAKPTVQLEHRFVQYGSSVRWIRWIAKAILGADDKVIEIQAVGFDITEYRQQTDQMVQREMLFSNIFTYTTDFLTVYRLSSSGELLLESFNRTVDDGSGYAYAQFLGRNVRDLVTSKDRSQILAKYRACVEQKEAQTFEEDLVLLGSTKYLSTTIIPVLNNLGDIERVVTLSRDISKFKIAEAELNAAKAAAEVANETKSDFLASMSHELRSPLNVVIGMSELLQERELDESAREQVKSIQRSGKVLLTLIEDILDISKIEAGKTKFEYSNMSLTELMADVQESFKLAAAQKGILLVVKMPTDGIDRYIGDVGRIRQIITNFVSNAIKFTDQGSVEIALSSLGHKTSGRRLVRFEVKDTGIGIPEEYHTRIFKKFSQVDSGLGRKYGGTGLGLVISQRLTSLMHGQIGFNSEWNKGSQFWFELPLTIAAQTSEVKAKPAPQTPVNASLSAKILAVDDSPDGRMLLQMLLKRLGHTCVMVDGGEAAVEAIQNEQFDLVLMDVQMPGMDGYETTTRIRRLNAPCSQIPIIALTANAMVGDSEKCFDAGMNDYVTKPINSDLLRGVIVKWAKAVKMRANSTADH